MFYDHDNLSALVVFYFLWKNKQINKHVKCELVIHKKEIGLYLVFMCFSPALVRMAGSLKFGSHVSKICLPESFNYFQAGKRCIVTGWGHTYWQGSSSPVLREAWVDLVGKEGCNSPRLVMVEKACQTLSSG